MTDNANVDIQTDDLDEFEQDFFQTREAAPEKEVAEVEEDTDEDEVDTDEDDSVANEDEDEDASEEEDEDSEDESEEEEDEEEPEPQPKKKNRKSARERIEELVAKTREQERREAELVRRLEQIEAQANKVEKPDDEVAQTPLREMLPADAPSPDAVDKDGEPVYALGEFDPAYIRDLTKFTIEQEREADRKQQKEEAQKRELETAQQQIQQKYADNLEKVKEEYPDYPEKILNLEPVVKDLDPEYGDYIASLIMQSDAGPQIMYYLSDNIGEAQKIVASGPTAATLAIGRLEARFITADGDEKRNKPEKKVSKASPPPEQRTRGAQGKFRVRPDTDDLDAFEKEFFPN